MCVMWLKKNHYTCTFALYFRYISLDNGLRVLLISDLKEGESVVDEDVESEEESEEEEVGDDEMEMDENSDEEVDENIANSQQIERKVYI